MNETNRVAIVLLAALWIVLMAVVIFVAWVAYPETVDRLGDFEEYLIAHDDDASRLILTLGALVLIVLSLLVIIVELAPEEEAREIRVEQAGATTIVPAQPLQQRLEEALTGMSHVSAAKARVFSQDKGIGMKLDLTVTPDANIAVVTQEASRVVVETLQADLGLPVGALPQVRIVFGPAKAAPVASSVSQPPAPPAQEAARPSETASPEPTAPDVTAEPAPGRTSPENERPLQPPPSAPGWEEPPATEEPPGAQSPPPDDRQEH